MEKKIKIGKAKGFYFSLDAMLAVIILFLFLSTVNIFVKTKIKDYEKQDLESYSLTLASMMEKSLEIRNLSNQTQMQTFINNLKPEYCVSYYFYDFPPPTNDPLLIFNITKSGCSEQKDYYQSFRSVTNSTLIRNQRSYGFILRVWPKS